MANKASLNLKHSYGSQQASGTAKFNLSLYAFATRNVWSSGLYAAGSVNYFEHLD